MCNGDVLELLHFASTARKVQRRHFGSSSNVTFGCHEILLNPMNHSHCHKGYALENQTRGRN